MSAPGWYPDPSGVPRQRYYDGSQWTEQYTPLQQQKKSRVWLWVLLSIVGVVALAFGGCVAFVGSVASNMEEAGNSSASQSGATVGSGTAARDGRFEFTVSQVTSGSQYAGELDAPRGQWFIADVLVENIGNEPQSFFVGNQKLIDTSGREYAADDMAAIRINEDSMVLDLGPGFSLRVLIPFDVPAGTVPEALELHDSAFSGGVRVSV